VPLQNTPIEPAFHRRAPGDLREFADVRAA
jgi:hypothetical protein